jgi:hypothetical protein
MEWLASANDLELALASLKTNPRCMSCAEWLGNTAGIDESGLYGWWVDGSGAADLSSGLAMCLEEGRIYVGQTGATQWPSERRSTATLGDRLSSNHLNGRVRGSTFRRTLGACLKDVLGLVVVGRCKLDVRSEQRLSQWMRGHLTVATYTHRNRDTLAHLEERVLTVLDPPLNLDGMNLTPLRNRLRKLRQHTWSLRTQEVRTRAPKEASAPKRPSPGDMQVKLTLHEEISEILRGYGNGWMTVVEIAKLVNDRCHYRKRDGSEVTSFQIHGRTRNYPHMFERDGSRVRLVRDNR